MTADNYLMQPKIIKRMLKDLNYKDYDYAYVDPLSHYAGELVKSNLFFKFKKISKLSKEHVTWDYRSNKKTNVKKYENTFLGINHKNSITLDNINNLILMKYLEKKYLKLKKIDCLDELKKIKQK